MSTPATIARKTIKGYDYIRLNGDGYPDHAFNVLKKHYTDYDKVRKLINLGDAIGKKFFGKIKVTSPDQVLINIPPDPPGATGHAALTMPARRFRVRRSRTRIRRADGRTC